MRLAIGAGFLAAIGLFAFGPAGAAYATAESPDPTPPVVTEEPSEEASATEMSCAITSTTDDDVTITFAPPEAFADLTVTLHDENVEFEERAEHAIVLPRPDTAVEALLEAWDSDNQQRGFCTVELPGDPQTEPPPASETPVETEPTEEPESPEPTPTDASPTQTTPEPTGTPESVPSTSSPGTPAPTEPSTPTRTPSTPTTPQPPIASAPPTPYAPPPASTPSPSPTATTPPSEDLNAADTERRGPREIRPLAESPRYLLPEIFGMQSHRGSPLVMPGPLDADERASELETLPPISEDELDAIKAQLSSPGHADRTPTGSHVESAAPQEPDAGQGSWWLLGGLTSAVGIGAVLWWALKRYRRNH